MKRSDGRILTTHTGSLPRPRALAELYWRRSLGEAVDAAALADAAHAAVVEVIAREAEAGLDVVNDGEQNRSDFVLFVRERMTGFGGEWDRPPVADRERYPEFKRMMAEASAGRHAVSLREKLPMAIATVRHTDIGPIEAECRGLAEGIAAHPGRFAEGFLTAPSPGIIAMAVKNQHYDSLEGYLAALGEALRPEYEAIVRAGFVLQIDSPDLGVERNATFAGRPIGDFVAFAESVIATINRAIRNIPADRVRLHVCWGNLEAPHDSDVALADILPAVREAKVGALVLPFATGRQAHEYRTFERIRLPDAMALVAGVIDTRTNVIEHPEAVADRIERVAAVIGDPARVLAGTDCGFDTTAGSGRVASDVAWAKLAALAEGARIASARLF